MNYNKISQLGSLKSDHVRLIEARGEGVPPEKLGRGERPASQNPSPIYDQTLRFSLPNL